MTLWFKIHVLVSLALIISDARGTLEPTVKKIEQKLGIPVYYAPSDSVDMDIYVWLHPHIENPVTGEMGGGFYAGDMRDVIDHFSWS